LGIGAAILGADVTLTDYYDMELLELNVKDNVTPPLKATVKTLLWYV
jgi:hypothetical protein